MGFVIIVVLILTIQFLHFLCTSLNRPSTPSSSPSSLRTGPIPLKTEPMDGDGGDDSNLGDLSPTTTKENKNGGEKDKIHNMNNNGNGGGAEEGGVVKANKGMILRKSVEYIRWVFFSFCLFWVQLH